MLGLAAIACQPVPAWRGLAKIGLILSFHGPAPADAMAIHEAVRAALIARNDRGGVDGTRLELVSLDDWNDADTSRRRVAELAADPFVVAALAAAPVASKLVGAGIAAAAVNAAPEANGATEAMLGLLERAARGGGIGRAAVLNAANSG